MEKTLGVDGVLLLDAVDDEDEVQCGRAGAVAARSFRDVTG